MQYIVYTLLVSQCSNASLRINLQIVVIIKQKCGTFHLTHIRSSHPLILSLSSPHSHSCSIKLSNSSLSTSTVPSIATYNHIQHQHYNLVLSTVELTLMKVSSSTTSSAVRKRSAGICLNLDKTLTVSES